MEIRKKCKKISVSGEEFILLVRLIIKKADKAYQTKTIIYIIREESP